MVEQMGQTFGRTEGPNELKEVLKEVKERSDGLEGLMIRRLGRAQEPD